ncbi:MAG: murein biosynthesis integral membrane protein MurJ, partial [Methylotenera sp.]|nr:murein biosynthesis integral membrane protein MurJ [Oligoflexia bacterium]
MEASLLKSASVVGSATLLSRILGLVREQVFAIFFGAGNLTDAFNIAFRIPNLLRNLFAEGALSSALVPTFTRVRHERGEVAAWRVAGLVFRSLLIVVSLLALVGALFSPQLVGFYASAFHQVPGKFELTVLMTRIIFPFFPLVALAAAYMGVLNACGKFFVPAFSSALFNLTAIVVGVSLSCVMPHYGLQPIVGMAIGVVAGALVQAVSQLPLLHEVGYRWVPRSRPGRSAERASDPGLPAWNQDPALRAMMALMIPGMAGLAATQVSVLINTVLATSQGPGAVSWLNYAFRLMQFPIGLFGASLAAAALPRVSQLAVLGDHAGVGRTLTQTLRSVFAINLPASAGLGFLGIPIIQLLFEYGHFRPEDTRSTAFALAAYAAGLTAYSVVKVLVPACYALGRTRIAVISSLLSVALTLALNLSLIRPLGYLGLALGTSVAAVFNAVFLLRVLKNYLPARELLKCFSGHLTVALAMGLLCFFSAQGFERILPDSGVVGVRLLRMGLLVGEGIGVVFVLSRVLGLPETTEVLDFFTKK